MFLISALTAVLICEERKMSNQDILSVFNSRYPELKVDKYMPCWISELGNEGIMILLDNGDVFISLIQKGGKKNDK
jgi:hypothetical protein